MPASIPRSRPSHEAVAQQPSQGLPTSTACLSRVGLQLCFGRAVSFLPSRRRSTSTPPISTGEPLGEIYRDQPVRRLCRAAVSDDGGGLGGDDRAAPVRGLFWPAALCL